MANNEWLEFHSVIMEKSVITDVIHENDRVYFKIDGREFTTFGNHIYHEHSPMFTSPFLDILSRQPKTIEEVEQEEKRHEDLNKYMDLWFKHKTRIYRSVITAAMIRLHEEGEAAFVSTLDHYFQIMEEGDNCHKLLNLIEEETKNNDNGSEQSTTEGS